MPVVVTKYREQPAYHLVFCRLITAAKHRGTVTYQELAKVMGLPLKGSHMGKEIGHILGEISEDEHQKDRPMLSAVAVNVKGEPGGGFFSLAEDLGLMNEGDEEHSFWERQREALYETWRERLDTYAHQEP